MVNLDSNKRAELDTSYHPKSEIVEKLPDPKTVRDMTEVFIKNQDGTYNKYQMVQGVWIRTGVNLTSE